MDVLHSWCARRRGRRPLRRCRRLLSKRLQIFATRKGADGIDVPCFIDGGRLTYEGSLAAHGYQRYKFKCTSHASCFKSRNAGDVQMSSFGHMEPVAFLAGWHLQGRCLETRRLHVGSPEPIAAAQWDWLQTDGHM